MSSTVISTLSVTDYILFASMLIFSAAIGIYFRFTGGKQKTTEEYLMAGKDMTILPVAFSLMASFLSSVTVLGVPSDVYNFGFYMAYMNIGYVSGMILATYMCVPVFFEMQVPTVYEYLERRFGPITRAFTSVAFVLQMILYMSVVLYGPALVLNTVAYLPTWVSVISIGLVCTFYCTLGGMKAVLWTDVFQALLMFLGIIIVLIKGFADVGFNEVFKIAYDRGRFPLPGFDLDPTIRYTAWGLILQSLTLSVSAFSSSQVQVQRLLTVKNMTRCRKSVFASIPLGTSFHLLTCVAGIAIFSHFSSCDPLSSPDHRIVQADQILPYYIMTALGDYPGLPGLCICGVFGASLSTVSSAVNSLTAVTMQDLVSPFLTGRGHSQRKVAFVAQLTTLFYGVLCIVFTFIVASFDNVVQASLTFFGMLGGPVLGVFLLGMFTVRANEKGAVVGLVMAIAISAWISFGGLAYAPKSKVLPFTTEGCTILNSTVTNSSEILNNVNWSQNQSLTTSNEIILEDISENVENIFYPYRISYMWYAPIGLASCFVFGYIASVIIYFITGEEKEVPIELISPFFKKLHRKKKDEANIDKKIPSGSEVKNEKFNNFSNDSNIKESIRL